jgi:eukaryotic-like serine/threonine-protein kinase
LLVKLRDLKSDLDIRSKLRRPAAPAATGSAPITTSRFQPGIGETAGPGANFTAGETFSAPADPVPTGEPQRRPRASPLLLAALAASVLLVPGAFYLNEYFGRESPREILRPAAEPIKQTRLTTLGRITDSAISPDGRFFAYIAKDGAKSALYVRQTATNDTVDVMPSADVYYGGLSFSPDGNHLYFNSGDNKKSAINDLYRIETSGGKPRKLIADVDSKVSFAPGGEEFSFRRTMGSIQESGIFIADADGTNERKIAARSLSSGFVGTPVWSPDGRTIATLTGNGNEKGEQYSLIGIDLEGGAEKPIGTKRWNWYEEIAWMPDGSELLLNVQEKTGAPHQLWRVAYPGGEVLKVTNDFNNYRGVSVTADASLVTVKNTLTANLFVAPFEKLENARQLTFVEGVAFYGISWTPNARIVYSSNLGGKRDIWMINADGSGQRQLTNDNFNNYDPVVTPDGRYIVYVSDSTGQDNIWRMNLDGGDRVQITGGNDGPGELAPSVTPDGKWIVYLSKGPNLWKAPIDGGEPVKLTMPESYYPKVSPDGQSIAFIFWGGGDLPRTLSVMPIAGGPPSRNFNVPPEDFRWQQQLGWTTDSRALIYVDSTPGYSNLIRLPLDDGKRAPMTDFKSERIFGFDASPDGRQMVFARGTTSSDAVMIDNIR